jgi:hypothetical protein
VKRTKAFSQRSEKHFPFARIAKHSALRALPLSGALHVYTRACTKNNFRAIKLCAMFFILAFYLCDRNCFFELWIFVVIIAEMVEEKKSVDPALASFYEAMERTNVEKITDEMLVGLSADSSDNESFDVESENEDAEDQPWRPSHVVFGKSTVKQGHIEAMKGKYFHDISVVRARGENIVPLPEADEVVVFKSFMKDGLHFPLHKMLVEVLKTFEIYLNQLTLEALIKVGVFIWAMRSQGLELDANCFCNIHELSYHTKEVGKEQYHNNFGCYNFVCRSDVRCLVPTFWKNGRAHG